MSAVAARSGGVLLALVLLAALLVELPAHAVAAAQATSLSPADRPSVQGHVSPAGDSRRTDAVLQAPLEQAWSRVDLACPGLPVLDDARTFAVTGRTHERAIIALDNSTGRTLWQTPPLATEELYPDWRVAYADGRVYASNEQGDHLALDARTGVRLWSRKLTSLYKLERVPPLAFGGRVYITDYDGTTALDGATGVLLFRQPAALSHVVHADGRLFAHGKDDRDLHAFSPEDGRLLWSTAEGARDFSQPPSLMVQDGRVFARTGVFEASSGRLLGPARFYVALDGELGVTRERGTLSTVAERVSDETPLWATARDDFSNTVLIAADALLRIGSRVTALDRVTGRPVWQSDRLAFAGDCSNDTPTRGANLGRDVLVVGWGGTLTAFREPRVALHRLEPDSGDAAGGQQVRILGSGLSGVERVRFGTADGSDLQVLNDRELTVRAPALPPGPVEVTAFSRDGRAVTDARSRYRALAPPSVVRTAPTSGPSGGGTLVAVVGSGLAGVTQVSFNGATAPSVQAVSDRELRVVAPAVPAGPVTISLTAVDGRATSVGWTAVEGPLSRASHPDRVDPGHSGAAAGPLGDDLVRIWEQPADDLYIPPLLVDGKVVTFHSPPFQSSAVRARDRDTGRLLWEHAVSPTVQPGLAYGAGAVLVADDDGAITALDAETGAVRWTRQNRGSSDPLDILLADDDLVVAQTVSDRSGIDPRTGLLRWHMQPAVSLAALGPNGLYSTAAHFGSPSKHDRRTGDLVWTAGAPSFNGFGVSPLVVGDRVLFEPYEGLSAANEATGESRVVGISSLVGRALVGETTFAFIDDSADAEHDPRLSAQRLEGPVLWTTDVRSSLGSPVVADGRVYVVDGQQTVRAFDAATGAPVWLDNAALVNPPWPPGFVQGGGVTAAERRLVVSTSEMLIVYAARGPRLDTVTPTRAQPGHSVTITGSGLSRLTDLRLGAEPVPTWSSTGDTLLTFTVPPHAPGGLQQLTASTDTTTAPLSDAARLWVDLPPSISDVSPHAGPSTGGQLVTVRGTGLSEADSVLFGDVAGTQLELVDDTTLRVRTPPGSPGEVAVTVRKATRASAPHAAARYSYRLLPRIDAVSPATGVEGLPEAVTLSGSGLRDAHRVLFGPIEADVLRVSGDNGLVVQGPLLAPGSYPVTVETSAGASPPAPVPYEVQAAPVPGAVRDLLTSPLPAGIRATWAAPGVPGGATAYRVVTEPAGADVTVPRSTSIADLPNLQPGREYAVTVVALGPYGSGVVSTSRAVAGASTGDAGTPPPSASPTSTGPSPRPTTSTQPSGEPSAGPPGDDAPEPGASPVPTRSSDPLPSEPEPTQPQPAPGPSPDEPGMKRLAGNDRYATAAKIVQDSFPAGPVPVVFIATGEAFADALAGGPAADVLGGPLLPVAKASIPTSIRSELDRLNPARIVILGGPGAVSDAVARELQSFTSGTVTRMAGANRYDTAARVAREVFRSPVPQVLVATGLAFADALAGGAVGAKTNAPVLLVATNSLPPETAAALRELQPADITVLGGTSAVSGAVLEQLRGYTRGGVTRLAGDSRYSTAERTAKAFWPGTSRVVYLATGRNFPDALAGVPAAGRDEAPLLLVEPNCMPAATKREMERLQPSTVVVLGGTATVSSAAAAGTIC